ncbi:MAG: ArsR family transcriptional regulator, partial [Melioribacter sp.]|nr:ArsR family transcriptional regulator [Melioribacter sp.]
ILKMSQPRISRHLKILTESGILKYEKVAQKVFYYINRKDKTNKSIINLIERELYEERKNKIRDELQKAMNEGYKKDYEDLIRKYFEALEKEK